MKAINIKVVLGCLLLVFFTINASAQPPGKTNKEDGKKPVKLNKSQLPNAVYETFGTEYPVRTQESWYSYPVYDKRAEWYEDYPYVTSNQDPGTYIVEFNTNNTPYKAVYTKNGKKIATHKILNSDLPKTVSVALSKSIYKSWELAKEKEEIFKDKDSDQLKVYKVHVSKGNEKHTLYFQADGKLLKDKKVS